MSDYSKKEFWHDVNTSDFNYKSGNIDFKTYKSQIIYYTECFGSKKALAIKVLKDRNLYMS